MIHWRCIRNSYSLQPVCRILIVIYSAAILSVSVVGIMASPMLAFCRTPPIHAQMDSVTVVSDRMHSQGNKKIVVFEGHVIVTHQDIVLHSDRLFIYYLSDKKIDRMVADGNVTMIQGDQTASGKRAEYRSSDRRIVITGDPVLRRGTDVVSGSRVIIYPDKAESIVEGGKKERVTAVIQMKGKPDKRVNEDR